MDTVNPLVKRWQRRAVEDPDGFWTDAALIAENERGERRVMKAVTLDRDPGDISTIEDEGSVEEAAKPGPRCGRRSPHARL